jgi:hypothetical protein
MNSAATNIIRIIKPSAFAFDFLSVFSILKADEMPHWELN